MNIERVGKSNLAAGIPVISYGTIHRDVVYLCGITANPNEPLGDVKEQTRAVLKQVDTLLRAAGTDMDDFADHNDAWNEWVDQNSPPVRACLHSPRLWRPGLRVEIMVTAAK